MKAGNTILALFLLIMFAVASCATFVVGFIVIVFVPADHRRAAMY